MRLLLLTILKISVITCMSNEHFDVTSEERSLMDTNEVDLEDSNVKNEKERGIPLVVHSTKVSNSTEYAPTEKHLKKHKEHVPKEKIPPIPCPGPSLQNIEEDKSSTTLINYPFSVSIQRKSAHYASGALIGHKWILSTAAEFYNIRESIKLFRARLGSVDCKNGGTLVPLLKIEFHPSYVYGLPNFDLALLRTTKLVKFTDYIRPIPLSKIRTKVISAKFMVTYWPRVIVKGQALPPTAKEREKQNSMRVSLQRLIPRIKCSLQMYNTLKNTTLHESTLCLKPFVTHHTPCLPDAGAPVVAEDGLWGITSGWTSADCLKNQSPTVFTRVGALVVRVWLDAIIDAPTTSAWDSSKGFY